MIGINTNSLSLSEKFEDLLTCMLYVSFVVFSTDVHGIYFMAGLVILIVLSHCVSNGFPKSIHWGSFHNYILGIAVFCLASSLWAINPDYALEKALTMFELLIVFMFLYEVYYGKPVERILLVLMWSGLILSMYTIFFVGLENLQDTLEEGGRMENEFANVNVIGMCCATSIVIALYFSKIHNSIHGLLLCLPSIIVVAGTGSRKAFVILIIGLIFLAFVHSPRRRKPRFSTIVIGIIFVSLTVFLIFRFGIFAGTMERMAGMMASFTGNGDVDSSSLLRAYYRKLGFEQFLETPLLGIGMGNARLLALTNLGKDCYLHCNYAEVAANGGIVGLVVVYWVYLKFLMIEKSGFKKGLHSSMIIFLILTNLIMDYGVVSYYSKDNLFLIMIFCLHADSIRNSTRTIRAI